MVLYKVEPPKEESIVTRNKFVVDSILPIGIKAGPIKNTYFILFIAYQDYDESYIYLQLLTATENAFENEFIKDNSFNIANIDPNTEKGKAYNELISKMNGENLFGTDFVMKQNEEFPMLYKSIAVRGIDKTHCSVLDVNYTRDNYIKLRLYLDKLSNIPLDKNLQNFETIFTNTKYNNIEFVDIEKIKYDATTIVNGDNSYLISHYTMWCGPSKYSMNYITGKDADINHSVSKLSNPLAFDLYNSFYTKDFIVTDIIANNDGSGIIIYQEYSEINGSWKSTKALKLTKELMDQTNFIDPYNKIFKSI